MKSGFELCIQLDAIGLTGKKNKERKKERNKGEKEEYPSLITGRCNPPRH